MGRWIKENWWLALATLAGVMFTAAGVMSPFEGEVEGGLPWWGGMIVMLAFGALLLGGVWQRRRRRVTGDYMIALGTLPLFPLFWTVVLPVLGLLIAIPAITDAADARAAGGVTRHMAATPRGRDVRDRATTVLLVLVLASSITAVVAGSGTVAYGLVAPPLAVMVAHLVVRTGAMAPARRVGLAAMTAGMLHGILTVAVVTLADEGAVDLSSGLPLLSGIVMSIVTTGGLLLFLFGGRRPRDRARPA